MQPRDPCSHSRGVWKGLRALPLEEIAKVLDAEFTWETDYGPEDGGTTFYVHQHPNKNRNKQPVGV